jgi:hypothetical protein
LRETLRFYARALNLRMGWMVFLLSFFLMPIMSMGAELLPLCTVAMRFLFAWGYHKGGGSIMSNMLFHTASNLGYSVVVLAPTPQDPAHDKYWYFTIFCILIAVPLWTLSPIRRERVLPASVH